MSEAVYAPILDLMSDHKIRSIQEITSAVQVRSVSFAQVVQAITVLIGAGHLASVQSETQIKTAKQYSSKLNEALIDKAQFSAEITFLASAVTGGGILVNRFQQLFLRAMKNGMTQPKDWAKYVWSVISGQNQRLVKEGKTLETTVENIQELENQAKEFSLKRLPILKALEIV
jgi:hypothetical protein